VTGTRARTLLFAGLGITFVVLVLSTALESTVLGWASVVLFSGVLVLYGNWLRSRRRR
jgi:hypothetical protein